ncbi:MAG: efflux RND transporter periplasmic adaptor subunit [Vicingaceae bacterium]
MNTIYTKYLYIMLLSLAVIACNSKEEEHGHSHDENAESHKEITEENHEEGEHEEEVVHFSMEQFNALDMKVDSLPLRNVSSYVETNGQLEVPPQNEATVTAVIGANITSIKVIEGDQVKKGQVLATVSHPDLINLQTNYNSNWNELQYLEQEFNRQKRLYEEEIGSGKEFQKTKSEYNSKKALVNGLEAQLKLLGISTSQVKNGTIAETVAIKAPIEGFIRLVEVKTGQYVSPQKELFEIVNLEHIHADFMVFEKDVAKVKVGQKIRFKVESAVNELEALVYSVGKNFEENPKAIHIHAEIEQKQGVLLPGMYVRGKILTGTDSMVYALPESAIVKEGNKSYIFSATKRQNEWEFEPIEIVEGNKAEQWTEVRPLQPISPNIKVAWNNAYYLIAEMKKGEAEHDH